MFRLTFHLRWPGLALAVCGLVATTLTPVRAEKNPAHLLNAAQVPEIRDALQDAIDRRVIPGAVFWIEREGAKLHGAIGQRAVIPKKEAMTEDTIFDVASLTKVVATTPCIMLLVEQGKIRLDAPAKTYLPEFTGEGRENITVRHLLTHTSGMKPDIALEPKWSGYATGIHMVCTVAPDHAPDVEFRYSDINFIVLGEIVHRVTGLHLDEFAKQQVFGPLGMKQTCFKPGSELQWRIAPTERDENGVMLRGVVHDPTARRMGGVAGHAGLFSTAADLARYCRMILQGGELNGVRLLKPETVKLMTSVQTPPEMKERRGLGWDIDTRFSRPRGALFPPGSFGHTGFTGTCVWMDPLSKTFYVYLSSRLHGTNPKTDSREVYDTMGTEAALCVLNYDFFEVPDALDRHGD
jgi:CubicO group peptidase (beta-lactamase class C family)